MFNQQFYLVVTLLMVLDASVLIGTGYLAYLISLDYTGNALIMAWNDVLGAILFLMFLNNYLMGRFGFYSAKRFSSTWTMLSSLFTVVLLDFLALLAGFMLVGVRDVSRIYVLVHFGSAFTLLAMTRVALYFYLDKRAQTAFNSRQILLVGSIERIEAALRALERQPSWGHKVAGCLRINGKDNPGATGLPVLGVLEDFGEILRENQIDEVIFALPKGSPIPLKGYFETCNRMGVGVKIMPSLFDPGHPVLKAESIQGIPLLTEYGEISNAAGLLYKRILDMTLGTFGFLIFLASYPIIGALIKLDSPGPVLFKTTRIGQHGRRFFLYKFRSMQPDAEAKKAALLVDKDVPWPIYKVDKDPRVTRIGRFLRKTSLDELPQFINVLKGEMSLVGTRPPTSDEVRNYEEWHLRRIAIRPGLTGLWQVSGRKEITDFAEVVRLDLKYIDGWHFANDLIILWKTFWVVLARKGAR